MEITKKLAILTESAKYDVACTSSGAQHNNALLHGGMGNAIKGGCCHAFSADGRCISLLKILMSNACIYDCKYCVNRKSNDIERASFTPEELAELTIEFYRRNYIEGLFLSSGVEKNPDDTTEKMIKTLELLRYKHKFQGYIHAKGIPKTSPHLIEKLGFLADRLSINIEMPSENSLKRLAPNKTREGVLAPMRQIAQMKNTNSQELMHYTGGRKFAAAGQATQMIIGASPESDYQILKLTEGLYGKYNLKRVFFSAYIAVSDDSLLPAPLTPPPLLREHRLYQADWLLRFYHFQADEILSEKTPNFNPYLDPKCNWAIHNMEYFPVDVHTASLDTLLRVPGIGPTSAKRIVQARRASKLYFDDLKRMGAVMKRAQYFIQCADTPTGIKMSKESTVRALIDPKVYSAGMQQLSMFQDHNAWGLPGVADVKSIGEATKEAVLCLSAKL